MKKNLVTLLGSFTLLVLTSAHLLANGEQQRKGPPPEAFSACEGKSAGDDAQFEGRNGESITGICEDRDGTLILRPDSPPPNREQ